MPEPVPPTTAGVWHLGPQPSTPPEPGHEPTATDDRATHSGGPTGTASTVAGEAKAGAPATTVIAAGTVSSPASAVGVSASAGTSRRPGAESATPRRQPPKELSPANAKPHKRRTPKSAPASGADGLFGNGTPAPAITRLPRRRTCGPRIHPPHEQTVAAAHLVNIPTPKDATMPAPTSHRESHPNTGGLGDNAGNSVWLTGQICSRDQRKGRYISDAMHHPGKMLPAIARHAIATYTAAGDWIADPMCGIGTTLVEAIHAGRNAIGVEYEQRWTDLAAANLRHAQRQGATGTGRVWCGDGRHIDTLVPAEIRGKVALVITSPPYGPSTHGRALTGPYRDARKILKVHHRYGNDRTNLAYAGHDELAAGFTNILAGCREILRPGGVVVVTARPYRRHGELIDIPGMVIAAGQAAGLQPLDRCVALLAGLRDGRLVPRGSFFQIHNLRAADADGGPPQLMIAHEDVIIFFKPQRDLQDHLLPPGAVDGVRGGRGGRIPTMNARVGVGAAPEAGPA